MKLIARESATSTSPMGIYRPPQMLTERRADELSRYVLSGILALVMWSGTCVFAAHGEEPNDLRYIRVGMAVKELPKVGYADLSCAEAPNEKLSGWENWRKCPAGAEGAHALRFDYDRETNPEGTIVAGHPVILTLSVDTTGRVAELLIETDRRARPYKRKKAFLLGIQAKSRYGSEGWACADKAPSAEEQPVGGIYINEQCCKTVDSRSVVIDRRLFRRMDRNTKDFVNETRIHILLAEAR